jgi:hypothetical protein
MKNKKDPVCDNIFCLHHESNGEVLADWNKTRCSYYEVDPYYKGNPNGINIENCEALKKYKKYGW